MTPGYYSCLCPRGHYGRGLQGDCHSRSPVLSPPQSARPGRSSRQHRRVTDAPACPALGTTMCRRQAATPGATPMSRHAPVQASVPLPGGLLSAQWGMPADGLPPIVASNERTLCAGRVQECVQLSMQCEVCIRVPGDWNLTYSQLSGSGVRLCLPSGAWSGEPAECRVSSTFSTTVFYFGVPDEDLSTHAPTHQWLCFLLYPQL